MAVPSLVAKVAVTAPRLPPVRVTVTVGAMPDSS
jgi:hypothetical protein